VVASSDFLRGVDSSSTLVFTHKQKRPATLAGLSSHEITRNKLRALPFLFFVLILTVAVRTAALRLVALVFVFGSRCAPFVLLLLILIRTVLALPALVFPALSLPVLFVCH